MTSAVCPYCRCPIDEAEREQMVCNGCGTPHHADCFAENGGCTIFGCSAAPAEEAKLSVSGSDLAATGQATGTFSAETNIAAPPAPPPPPGGLAPSGAPQANAGSVLFQQPVPAPQSATGTITYVDLTPDPNAKNRTTFIVLGVLLGMLGAHNFYAGYKNKALAQLCISALTLGFASPMSWVWAVIDVCTVDADSGGIKFRT
ncbi:MAG TPA: NINE protein [Candidatus Angelobacter sp.]